MLLASACKSSSVYLNHRKGASVTVHERSPAATTGTEWCELSLGSLTAYTLRHTTHLADISPRNRAEESHT